MRTKKDKEVRIRSVKFNVLMNMILTTSSFLFPLITVPYVSRVLSTTGTGAVAFAQSVASWFSLIAVLGMATYGVRACSSVRDDKDELSRTVKELLIILAVSTFVVSVLYVIALLTMPKMIDETLLFSEFLLYIWFSSFSVSWFFQAIEQYGYITIRDVAFKLLALVLMFALVRNRADYVIYGAIIVFVAMATACVNLFRLFSLVDMKKGKKLNPLRHAKPMAWFAIASISSGLYTQADIVILGFMGTPSMVGLYQLVAKIKNVMVTALNSVGGVMLPRLSYYEANDSGEKSDELVAKNINFALIAGLAVAAFLNLCAEPIVWIMGGDDFSGSVDPLRIIGWAALLSSLNIILAYLMISRGLERRWATVNIAGLITVVLLDIVLIPPYGVNGAAIGIVGCEAFMLLLRMLATRSMIAPILRLTDPIRTAASATVAWVATYLVMMYYPIEGIILQLLLPFVLFCLLYTMLLLFFRESLVWELLHGMASRVLKNR